MARHYLAVPGPADPRYDDLLRGFMVTAHPDFRALRAALFTRCEQEDSEDADTARLAAALEQLSVGYAPQRLLVTGHTIVAERHLRLASSAYAHPAASRAYLLFDAARSIDSIGDLLRVFSRSSEPQHGQHRSTTPKDPARRPRQPSAYVVLVNAEGTLFRSLRADANTRA